MVSPIGILATYAYYQQGFVDLNIAALICLGFIFGGWFRIKIAINLSQTVLQKNICSVFIFSFYNNFFFKIIYGTLYLTFQ